MLYVDFMKWMLAWVMHSEHKEKHPYLKSEQHMEKDNQQLCNKTIPVIQPAHLLFHTWIKKTIVRFWKEYMHQLLQSLRCLWHIVRSLIIINTRILKLWSHMNTVTWTSGAAAFKCYDMTRSGTRHGRGAEEVAPGMVGVLIFDCTAANPLTLSIFAKWSSDTAAVKLITVRKTLKCSKTLASMIEKYRVSALTRRFGHRAGRHGGCVGAWHYLFFFYQRICEM